MPKAILIPLPTRHIGAAYQDGKHIVVIVPFFTEDGANKGMDEMVKEGFDPELAETVVDKWQEEKK